MARLAKRKQKTAGALPKRRRAALVKKMSRKRALPKKPTFKVKKEVFGVQETVIEQAKFSHPGIAHVRRMMPDDLPSSYGKDKIILQVRDPWWIHAYWEVTQRTIDRLKDELKDDFHKAKRLLRVYDVSNIHFNGKNAHRFFDIAISEYANNWYIDTGGPGRSWCVELGLLLPGGRFIMIVRSNVVQTPTEGPSWITDEEWMIPEDMFARLYGMGFGFGRSSPVGKGWQQKIKREFISSGIASMASPVKKMVKEKKFWLVVNTELIVYGATEPDAKVLVQGKEIRLRPDGTFSLRFALPDGKQVIPVEATSCDGEDKRTITPIVNKETK
ncbi:DUF4912 domain-containing protein [bacterium]|nr:MAG: DUF4912 domain-containing protein [bacterium]